MSTKKNVYDSVKKAAEKITVSRNYFDLGVTSLFATSAFSSFLVFDRPTADHVTFRLDILAVMNHQRLSEVVQELGALLSVNAKKGELRMPVPAENAIILNLALI